VELRSETYNIYKYPLFSSTNIQNFQKVAEQNLLDILLHLDANYLGTN
jgi:hypothetical protein